MAFHGMHRLRMVEREQAKNELLEKICFKQRNRFISF